MSKDYEEPPSIQQVLTINGNLHKQIKQLQAELIMARKGNYSGCVHTIGTAVDREGCCTSCGEDLNYLAMMQIKLDTAIDALQDLYDEQNGPPLLHHEKSWQAGMDKAGEVLGQTRKEVEP